MIVNNTKRNYKLISMDECLEISDAYNAEKNKKEIEFKKQLFSPNGLDLLFSYRSQQIK